MGPSFGKYQVVEFIGEGGFGKVYKGFDPSLKREVAIKTCTLRHPDVRARFIREAEIAAKLRHPRIVTIYDFGEQDDEPYLVQEYLSGEDLDKIVKRQIQLPLSLKLMWLIELAEGLAFAHAQGVVHRDVKPSNVRVQEDGHIRIMDFGIAKLMEAEQQLTQTGLSVGTTGYLAPEQLKGEEIDHRADIFSFGVLAYELVAYRRPFEGDSMTTIFYRIAHEPPPPITDAFPDCPPRLAACITRCLEKDRNERYPTLTDVALELERIRRELELPQGDDAAAAAAATPASPATDAATAAAAATAAPTPAAPSFAEPTPAEPTAAPEPVAAGGGGPSPWRAFGGLLLACVLVAVFAVFTVTRWVRSSSREHAAATAAQAATPGAAANADAQAPTDAAAASAAADPAAGATQLATANGAAAPGGPSAASVGGATGAADGTGAPSAAANPGAVTSQSGAGGSQAGAHPAPATAAAPPASHDVAAAHASPRPANAPTQSGTAAPATGPAPAGAAAANPPAAPAPSGVAMNPKRVLVLLRGGAESAVADAESAFLEELMNDGLETVDENALEGLEHDPALAAGQGGRIGALGRSFGAGLVVLGELSSEAAPSVGQFYTGTATLVVKMYDGATGKLVGSHIVRVGGGGTAGKLGPTPQSAASAASAEAGRQGARVAAQRLGAS